MTCMTLGGLRTSLASSDPTLLLIFMADGTPIRGGYHVTEFKSADVASMTCGGDRDAWAEARIEIMEGHGMGGHMQVGKFVNIVDRVLAKMPRMADLPLVAEFGPDHAGLKLYDFGDTAVGDEAVIVPLEPRGAICKAATTPNCCKPEAAACCG